MLGVDPSGRYDQIVRLAYQDAFEARPWQTFVSELATTLGSRDASLQIYTKGNYRNRLLVTNDSAPHLTESYIDGMMGAYFLKKLPAKTPMTLDDFGVTRSFLGSSLFKRYLAPYGITHILTQDVYEDSDVVIRLSADREQHQGDFGEAEKSFLLSITPHIRQALNIRNRFQEVDGLAGHFQDLLAKMGVGCIVIGSRWEVLRVNEAAHQAMQGDLGFTTQAGYLRLRNSPRLKKLRLAIDAAVHAHCNGLATQPGVSVGVQTLDGSTKLNVAVKPLFLSNSSSLAPTPAVLLLLNDGAAHSGDIDASLLMSIYQLTRCEAKLGVLLAKGHTLKESAEELHVSINTIKTQQQRIYDKLGVNRRSQVVNMLAQCTAKLL